MRRAMLLLGVLVLGWLNPTAHSPALQATQIAYCLFSLPDDLKRTNTSFTLRFSFRLDEDGRPTDIKELQGTEVAEDEGASCISQWRFPGIDKGSLLLASFRWEHGVGWTYLSITGRQIYQTITIAGDLRPHTNSSRSK